MENFAFGPIPVFGHFVVSWCDRLEPKRLNSKYFSHSQTFPGPSKQASKYARRSSSIRYSNIVSGVYLKRNADH